MGNLDLLNYISQARKSGMTDGKIREGLLQSGWSEADINEAMVKSSVSAPSVSGRSGFRISKLLAFTLSAILFAVLAYAGGAYYMAKFQNFVLWPFEASVEPVATITPRPSLAPSTSSGQSAEMVDWQTYRNEEYGFELKMPSDWTFLEFDHPEKMGVEQINFASAETKERYEKNKIYCSDQDNSTPCNSESVGADMIFRNFSNQESAEPEKLIINGITFFEYRSASMFGERNYVTEKNGKSYNFSVFREDSAIQILSTFKFIK